MFRDPSRLLPLHLSALEVRELEEYYGAHVQTITLEPKDARPENTYEQELMGRLRNGTGKLRCRTWKEAYEIALEAKTNSAEGGAGHGTSLPISPLWESPRHKMIRDRW